MSIYLLLIRFELSESCLEIVIQTGTRLESDAAERRVITFVPLTDSINLRYSLKKMLQETHMTIPGS